MISRAVLFKLLRYSGLPFLFRELVQRRRVTILLFHDISRQTAARTFDCLSKRYHLLDLQTFIRVCQEERRKSQTPQGENPKFQAPNPKQMPNRENEENPKRHGPGRWFWLLGIWIWDLFRISNFVSAPSSSQEPDPDLRRRASEKPRSAAAAPGEEDSGHHLSVRRDHRYAAAFLVPSQRLGPPVLRAAPDVQSGALAALAGDRFCAGGRVRLRDHGRYRLQHGADRPVSPETSARQRHRGHERADRQSQAGAPTSSYWPCSAF